MYIRLRRVAGERVCIGSLNNKVYCLNATTGDHLWDYTTGDSVYSSPAMGDGKVYVGSDDHHLYCLNATTGDQMWNYTTGAGVTSSPAVAGECVYVGSDDNHIYCLNATTGDQLWNSMTGGGITASPDLAGGRVFIGSLDGTFYCFSAGINVAPMITSPGDVVYAAGTTGHSISWTVTDTTTAATSYIVYQNESPVASGSWASGSPILQLIDGLLAGSYNFTIVVLNGLGGIATDQVWVIVTLITNSSSDQIGDDWPMFHGALNHTGQGIHGGSNLPGCSGISRLGVMLDPPRQW